jgi:hypothetical protein
MHCGDLNRASLDSKPGSEGVHWSQDLLKLPILCLAHGLAHGLAPEWPCPRTTLLSKFWLHVISTEEEQAKLAKNDKISMSEQNWY